jgi:hypothetical protein
MSSLVKESIAVVGFATILVGGVYLMLPKWGDLPTGDQAEDVAARILLSPINIAGKLGNLVGSNIMYGLGYEYTAADLERIRPTLYANSTIPGTPENAAKRLHNVMQVDGQQEQLQQLQIDLLGSDTEWNATVARVYFPMFGVQLYITMDAYMRV